MRDIQDYDNDALVVHMGAFESPTEPHFHPTAKKQQQQQQQETGATSDSSRPSTPASGAGDAGHLSDQDAAAAGDKLVEPSAAAAKGQADSNKAVQGRAGGRSGGHLPRRRKVLHLYAVAAPGMRRAATTTLAMSQCESWAAPVELKLKWRKVQKGYFDAPGKHGSLTVVVQHWTGPETI